VGQAQEYCNIKKKRKKCMQLDYKFNHKNAIKNTKNGGKQQYSYISPMEKLEICDIT
jgi:hypothetical protein